MRDVLVLVWIRFAKSSVVFVHRASGVIVQVWSGLICSSILLLRFVSL